MIWAVTEEGGWDPSAPRGPLYCTQRNGGFLNQATPQVKPPGAQELTGSWNVIVGGKLGGRPAHPSLFTDEETGTQVTWLQKAHPTGHVPSLPLSVAPCTVGLWAAGMVRGDEIN